MVERIQTKFYKKLMGLPLNSPASAVREEFGRAKTSVTIFKLCLNYLLKVQGMSDDRYPKAILTELKYL